MALCPVICCRMRRPVTWPCPGCGIPSSCRRYKTLAATPCRFVQHGVHEVQGMAIPERSGWLLSVDRGVLVLATVTHWRKLKTAKKKNWISDVSKRVPYFSLRQWERNEAAVAEGYCWAITQVARRSCCGISGSSVLEVWLSDGLPSMDTYIDLSDDTCTGLRLSPDLPERNNCASLWASIL